MSVIHCNSQLQTPNLQRKVYILFLLNYDFASRVPDTQKVIILNIRKVYIERKVNYGLVFPSDLTVKEFRNSIIRANKKILVF